MDDSTLNQIVIIVYMLAACVYIYRLISHQNPGVLARFFTVSGFVLHTGSLIWRWVVSYQMGFGHAPLSNRYESLVFFSWSIVLMFFMLERSLNLSRMGAFILPLAAGIIGSTGIIPGADEDIMPLMPALQSNWLIFHVVTCFLGYAAFAIACFAGIISLVKSRKTVDDDNWDLAQMDSIMYRTVFVGFLLLTLGIISGSAWAYNAWGRYWGWDPKEVWSLITWIVYAVFLHARFTRGWSGRRLAWISIIGFIFVLFTFLGVNYLPIFKGLHSYA